MKEIWEILMNNIDFQTQSWVCEIMVNMIPRGVKTILEPTPGAGNLVNAMSEYDVTAPSDFWNQAGTFDAVVMNPPFSPMAVGYEILYAVMNMSDIIIALMPWLTIINSQKRADMIFGWGLKSVIHLPRNAFPGSRVQTCILEMSKGHSGDTVISLAKRN